MELVCEGLIDNDRLGSPGATNSPGSPVVSGSIRRAALYREARSSFHKSGPVVC